MIDDPRLRSAVDGLYLAFAAHTLRDWTDPCLDCCASVESEAALHAAPLRELSFGVIREYAMTAMTTWGDEREFTHFLPRIFEIVATQDFDWPDIEVLFENLYRASWRSWLGEEQLAVEEYLMAKWEHTLATEEPIHQVEDVLVAIALAVDDLGPYLRAWEEAGALTASRHLAEFVRWSWEPEKQQLSSVYWENRLQQADQVLTWLHSMPVAERLTELSTAAEAEFSAEAMVALERLAAY